METDGIQPDVLRKADNLRYGAAVRQVTCSDCGHVYLAELGQASSACSVCGNVEFLGAAEPRSEARKLSALSEEIVARRILPRLAPREIAEATDPLAAFRTAPDGNRVEQLRMQYQVEWQLWAVLTQQFRDPAYHMAYLTQALAENRLEQAADRYREHRSVMALLEDSRWQAEVADLMLTRLENLALARMPASRGDYSFDIPAFLKVLPFDSRLPKLAWIVFGIFLAAKFLHFGPLHP